MDMIAPTTRSVLIELDRVNLYLPFRRRRDTAAREIASNVGGLISGTARREHVVALNKVSLTLAPGERLAVLGHNGAGKTSLLRVMAGIYEPSAGARTVNGRVLALLSNSIGMSPENTGRKNTHHAAALFDVHKDKVEAFVEGVVEFSGLGDFIDMPVKTYSSGMRTRLGFSIISSLDPDILLLDEVLSAGDMTFARKARDRIMSMIERAHGLVVTSHSADLMRLFCTRAVWLQRGEIIMDGAFEEVWQAYYESASQASP